MTSLCTDSGGDTGGSESQLHTPAKETHEASLVGRRMRTDGSLDFLTWACGLQVGASRTLVCALKHPGVWVKCRFWLCRSGGCILTISQGMLLQSWYCTLNNKVLGKPFRVTRFYQKQDALRWVTRRKGLPLGRKTQFGLV